MNGSLPENVFASIEEKQFWKIVFASDIYECLSAVISDKSVAARIFLMNTFHIFLKTFDLNVSDVYRRCVLINCDICVLPRASNNI